MKYDSLTVDEQTQILQQRLKQYEAEHFNHSVNKELLVKSGSNDEPTRLSISEADSAMKILDDAYENTKKKLDELKKNSGKSH